MTEEDNSILEITSDQIYQTKAAKSGTGNQVINIDPSTIQPKPHPVDISIINTPDGRLLTPEQWEQEKLASRAAREAILLTQKPNTELPVNAGQLAVDSLVQVSANLQTGRDRLSLIAVSDIFQQTRPDGTLEYVLDLGLLPPREGSVSAGSRLYASVTPGEANSLVRDLLPTLIRSTAVELLKRPVPPQTPKSVFETVRANRRIPGNMENTLHQIDLADQHSLLSSQVLSLSGHDQIQIGSDVTGIRSANTTLYFAHERDTQNRRPGLPVTISLSQAEQLIFKLHDAGLFDNITNNSIKTLAGKPL